jgi:hypothetical protein
VGRFPRDGSSPFGRMRSRWKSVVLAGKCRALGAQSGGPWQRFGNTDTDLASVSCMALMTASYEQRPAKSVTRPVGLRARGPRPRQSIPISRVARATEPGRTRLLFVLSGHEIGARSAFAAEAKQAHVASLSAESGACPCLRGPGPTASAELHAAEASDVVPLNRYRNSGASLTTQHLQHGRAGLAEDLDARC